jgi:hypothetical protein
MLNKSIPDQYKVLNTPNLTSWNVLMSIWVIFDQLMANYGMPGAMVLFNNDTLFQSPFPCTEAPKMFVFIAQSNAKRSKPLDRTHIP